MEMELSYSVYEGKTWIARITGTDPKYGLAREFVPRIGRRSSRSGRTGHMYYSLDAGTYEVSERGKRRFIRVGDDGSSEGVSRDQVVRD